MSAIPPPPATSTMATEAAWLLQVLKGKLSGNRQMGAAVGAAFGALALAVATRPQRPAAELFIGEATAGDKKKGELAAAPAPTQALSRKEAERRQKAKAHVKVDKAFVKNFRKLLAIAFPTLRSSTGLHLLLLSLSLLLRTGLSLKIAGLAGTLASTMVRAEAGPFFRAVLALGLWSVPASLINSGLKYLQALLAVAFRQNLSEHFHARYLTQQSFFRCVGLGAVDAVDQRVTQDVHKWSEDTAGLFSSIFKPIIDIFLFSYQVSRFGGWISPGLIIGWYMLITVILRGIAPNFAAMVSAQQRSEGNFRQGHTHALSYAEEVVLSRGEGAQKLLLNKLFGNTMAHFLYIGYKRAKHNIFEGLLVKYGSVMVGYGVCAISAFSKRAEGMSAEQLTGEYVQNSRLLVDLAKAIGALILTYKTVAGLAGYTHRVCELEASISAIDRAVARQKEVERGEAPAADEGAASVFAQSMKGEVVVGDSIKFEKVPLISPDGTTLVKELTFYVKAGMSTLVIGPNGCGKSSTFRLLGELWPLQGGRIEKPSYEHLYYVPQRPYMTVGGTLRDQVTYPSRASELRNASESRLHQCLCDAGLEDLLDRPNVSWDSRLDWAGGDVLSHGEKQRLAMARLFFHKPRFAILDECSSAMDLDVEERLYQECTKKHITLLTIAHRRSVWRYHQWVLRFDGDGGYQFSPLAPIPPGEVSTLVLEKVMFASDPSLIGRRLEFTNVGVQVNAEEAEAAP